MTQSPREFLNSLDAMVPDESIAKFEKHSPDSITLDHLMSEERLREIGDLIMDYARKNALTNSGDQEISFIKIFNFMNENDIKKIYYIIESASLYNYGTFLMNALCRLYGCKKDLLTINPRLEKPLINAIASGHTITAGILLDFGAPITPAVSEKASSSYTIKNLINDKTRSREEAHKAYTNHQLMGEKENINDSHKKEIAHRKRHTKRQKI